MRKPVSPASIPIALVLLVCLAPSEAAAQWLGNGTPFCTAPGDQTHPCIVPDGAGGVVTAWIDDRAGPRIYAQRLDADGHALWTAGGVDLGGLVDDAFEPVMVSDGAGGAIVAWSDYLEDALYLDVRAQRVGGDGTVLWGSDGLLVCGQPFAQYRPAIAEDGAGGAVVVWQDQRDLGTAAYYGQRILADGTFAWAVNGVLVSGASWTMQLEPAGIVATGSGSTIVTADAADGIRAQRLSSLGLRSWGTDGLLVSPGSGGGRPMTDALGGALVVWAAADHTWRARRILANGNLMWAADGAVVGTWEGSAGHRDFVADGAGGGMFCWSGEAYLPGSYTHRWGVWVQKFDDAGRPQWGDDGVVLRKEGWDGIEFHFENPRLAPDGGGGAIVTWSFDRYEDGILAQRVRHDGSVLWEDGGRDVCRAPWAQAHPEIVPDGYRGAFIVWDDARDPATGADIYAQRIITHECEVAPTAIDLGTVLVGDLRADTFTLSNVGGIPVTGEVVVPCADFRIHAMDPPANPYTLAPGEVLHVAIGFSPTAEGPQTCLVDTGDSTCGDVEYTAYGFPCPDRLVYVDAEATGRGDGSSWADAFTELREALAVAGLCGNVNEIWVAEGTYRPSDSPDRTASFVLDRTMSLYGGFAGTEASTSDRDIAAHPTILSGDLGGVNSYHVVTLVDAPFVSLTVDGFVIRDGVADGPADADQEGGGIRCLGDASLRNLTLRDNAATRGGGLYCEGGTPGIRWVTFEANTATSTGGGMFNIGGDLSLREVVFRGNSGRGLYTTGGDGLVREALFAGNSDGGLHNDGGGPTLVNTVFHGNTGATGAGMRNANGAAPRLVNVTFHANTATGSGGALANGKASNPVIVNAIFWGNEAPTAPEISNNLFSTPLISHCLIEDSGGSGGGWDTSLGTDGGHNLDADPRFRLEQSADHPLSLFSFSPAINAGSNAALPAGVPQDLAQGTRIYDGTVDLGAYEHQGVPTGVGDDTPGPPRPFVLLPGVPNPFNPETTIRFDLPRPAHVHLAVYDLRGGIVATLIDQPRGAGRGQAVWSGRDDAGRAVTSGVYFCRLVAGELVATRKLLLLR